MKGVILIRLSQTESTWAWVDHAELDIILKQVPQLFQDLRAYLIGHHSNKDQLFQGFSKIAVVFNLKKKVSKFKAMGLTMQTCFLILTWDL